MHQRVRPAAIVEQTKACAFRGLAAIALRYTGGVQTVSAPHPLHAMTESNGTSPVDVADGGHLLHELKNHLAVILGFCDVLLNELPETDPRRADVVEIHRAAQAAAMLLPELSTRIR